MQSTTTQAQTCCTAMHNQLVVRAQHAMKVRVEEVEHSCMPQRAVR